MSGRQTALRRRCSTAGRYLLPAQDLLRQAASAGRVPRRVLPADQDLIAWLLAKVSIGEWKDYPGMPQPKHSTLAESQTVINNLLLYWIQHGRVRVVPGISRIDGKAVTFTDSTQHVYDTILWATGFHASLPFLDEKLIQRRNGVPLRYAGGLVPVGLERLYYIGLSAPRGPQTPIYGVQTKLAIRMIALHEAADEGGADVQAPIRTA